MFRHKLVKLDLTIRPDGKSLSAADLEGWWCISRINRSE